MSALRLMRALSRGSVGVLNADGLTVYRRNDLRSGVLGVLSLDRAETLKEKGALVSQLGARGETWHWCAGHPLPGAPERTDQIAAPAPAPRSQPTSRRFLEILTAPEDDGGPRRQAAAKRFLSEMERAASTQTITMNWRGLAEGRISGGARLDGPVNRGGRAQHNLGELHKALGARDMRYLEGIVVREWSCSAFGRRLGLIRHEDVKQQARALLDRLADAYDLYVPSI